MTLIGDTLNVKGKKPVTYLIRFGKDTRKKKKSLKGESIAEGEKS